MKMGLGTISGLFMTLTLAFAFILFYKGQINVLQAFGILWGNILSLTFWDIVIIAATSVFVVVVVVVFFKEIQAILYDREVALSVGIPERQLYYLIVFMLGLTIAVSMRLIGALLVDAFVLLPAIAARLIARSLKQMFILSSLFGLISGFGGIHCSLAADIPVSSSIIITASVIIVICMLFKRRFIRYDKIF
jgi:ABC-type Mn2+/Zn2+ transport system permease subunit